MFGGGFNVGINATADKVIYNDSEKHVVDLMKYLKETDTDKLLYEIDSLIDKYDLSKENAEGFNCLREYYNNENDSPMVFYTLICYAFNNQIRFNQNGKYNMPFGKARSSFNPSLRQKFIDFVEELHKKNVFFANYSFDRLDISKFKTNDFIYCDPPYLNSVATYNEQGGWTHKEEQMLLDLLDKANELGIRFALSNNLKYENRLLEQWKDKYKIHYLSIDYANCNYQKKDKSKDIEVLITNY